jgi:IMP dehydrogenase
MMFLVPQRSEVLPSEVDLGTRISPHVHLRIPILSAAMDTVTEHALAIAIAREGGIGILHKNLTISEQANEVHHVKRAESGVVSKPYTVSPDDSLARIFELKKSHKIGGFPVVDNGRLVGIITNRDIRFETDTRAQGKSSDDSQRALGDSSHRSQPRRRQSLAAKAPD